LPAGLTGRIQMTADMAARTGEHRPQHSGNTRDRDEVGSLPRPEGVTVSRALAAITLLPALDWPKDLFVDAYTDDDESDGELTTGAARRATGRETPRGYSDLPFAGRAVRGTVIWRTLSPHAVALAGIAP
jgi:hypothetical protein